MNSWNGFDFFIFLILALNLFLGMSRGATKEIISIMCLSLALIITIKFTVPLAAFFNSSPLINTVVDNRIVQNFMMAIQAGPLTRQLLEEIFYSISMLLCFVGTFSICEAALAYSGFTETFSFPYAALNRKLGAVLGLTRGYIISLLIISILVLHIFKGGTGGDIRNEFFANSFFVNLFRGGAVELDSLISRQQPENYQQLYQKQNISPEEIYKQLRPQLPQQPASAPGAAPTQPSSTPTQQQQVQQLLQ